ncbi:DUF881 domain-containing protein [Mycolicibacter hiberniae]|uniref:Membrane protein n=1 Tax=Mycolicibacter hiberniae TaxID=29314 RepID=A0A7I7X9C1_9MYCO|nr:DUF881 domain-containing protein [Mycolicibacter hiberniae]MCV7088364.1 DUF881 domain-containing protein [Mycolicibacter hiberniae]ORV68806.1 hypothetical protein AWC09_14330 [Mycolicibacter hiberniae]BBZ25221.1 membrane protein [Mycolicibacter hiberniae]
MKQNGPPSGDRRSPWRLGVPLVCLAAGLLLAATHGVSGGKEIRRGDAPRLVDLVRSAQATVEELTQQRDTLAHEVGSMHGRRSGVALSAMRHRTDQLVQAAGLEAMHGPGLVVTLADAQRDANGRFPRDASPDDLVVHQQDISAVLNALWTAGAEAVQMQDQRITASSAPRCVGNTLLLEGRTYSPPYVVTAIGDPAAMQEALAADPLIGLYKQYVIRFGLGYSEQVSADLVVAETPPVARMRYAVPAGPVDY